MRKFILAAGAAACLLTPSLANADTCDGRKVDRAPGTLLGAGVGALLGSAVAGKHDRGTGAVVGGIGGAIVGNQLAKPNADCAHAYGYYDSNGIWHANSTPRDQAGGYYDRSGAWVDGAPSGYYDSNSRWVPAAGGAYDREGRWVPASNGGYYSSDGRWIATAVAPTPSSYQPDQGRDRWAGAPRDVQSRIDWLGQRIQHGRDDGSLDRRTARQSARTLEGIRRDAMDLRRGNGDLRPRDEQMLQARLDDLSRNIRWNREQSRDNRY